MPTAPRPKLRAVDPLIQGYQDGSVYRTSFLVNCLIFSCSTLDAVLAHYQPRLQVLCRKDVGSRLPQFRLDPCFSYYKLCLVERCLVGTICS